MATLPGRPFPSPAQEQTGRLEGVVRDERGGVLPGATVEARNLTVGSAFSVTTAEGGPFRLRFEDGVVTQILR